MKSTPTDARPDDSFQSIDAINFITFHIYRSLNESLLSKIAHRIAVSKGYWFEQNGAAHIEAKLALLLLHYVQNLPTCIIELTNFCQQQQWQTIAEKSCSVIADYFQYYPTENRDVAFLSLLNKTYFSHRLIEELHDHLMCRLGRPESKWNMTGVNLLVYHIIDQPIALTLEQTVVELAAKLLLEAPNLQLDQNQQQLNQQGQTIVWPCFCKHHGLDLVY